MAAHRAVIVAAMDTTHTLPPSHRLIRHAPSALAAALAVGPLMWLVRTWTHPGFNPTGPWIALLIVAIVVRSVRSGPARGDAIDGVPRAAVAMLAASVVLRVASVVAGVDVLGGLALVLDVGAAAAWLRLAHRPVAVSPGWLAALAVLALPIERLVQRIAGFGLQSASAEGACALLKLSGAEVVCAGVHLTVDGVPVVVDVPCAGTQSLHLVLVAFAAAVAHARPRRRAAIAGMALALAAAWATNAARIAWVALAAAHPALAFGADATQSAAHQAIGAVALAVAIAIVAAWGSRTPAAPARSRRPVAASRRALAAAVVVAAVGLGVVFGSTAHAPIDASATPDAVWLPTQLAGYPARDLPLRPLEAAAWQAHGGRAQRVGYGALTVVVTQTTSPLRHLHDPTECLRALGWSVHRVGLHDGPMPGALYRATAPDGAEHVVRVAFVSSDGDVAASVPEAVWRWMRAPGATWTGVQRIAPVGTAARDLDDIDRALAAAVRWPEVTSDALALLDPSRPGPSRPMPRNSE